MHNFNLNFDKRKKKKSKQKLWTIGKIVINLLCKRDTQRYNSKRSIKYGKKNMIDLWNAQKVGHFTSNRYWILLTV